MTQQHKRALIIAHGDIDGMASAALLLREHPDATLVFTQPTQIETTLEHCVGKEHDFVVIADIAIPSEPARRETVKRLIERINGHVQWFDHHPGEPIPAKNMTTVIDRTKKMSASLLVHFTHGRTGDEFEWLARLGGISDKYLRAENGKESEEVHLLDMAFRADVFDDGFRRHVVKELSSGKRPSEIADVRTRVKQAEEKLLTARRKALARVKVYSNMMLTILDDPDMGLMGRVASELAETYALPAFVIFPDAYEPEKYMVVTARRPVKQNTPDLNELLRDTLRKVGGDGGGHPGAAGGKFPKERLQYFIDMLTASP